MMTERPILFSAPMVRAILAGSKTQTRRVLKPQPQSGDEPGSAMFPCPHGRRGDRIYVREAFSYTRGEGIADRGGVWYWADGNPQHGDWARPKPSIHMPRWASRITLEVTAVRVELLQDISAIDIVSEGAVERAHNDQFGHNPVSRFDGKVYLDLRSLWRAGWESINGPDSWAANPWVWVVEFRRAT